MILLLEKDFYGRGKKKKNQISNKLAIYNARLTTYE